MIVEHVDEILQALHPDEITYRDSLNGASASALVKSLLGFNRARHNLQGYASWPLPASKLDGFEGESSSGL
jgi:hypothetical protein